MPSLVRCGSHHASGRERDRDLRGRLRKVGARIYICAGFPRYANDLQLRSTIPNRVLCCVSVRTVISSSAFLNRDYSELRISSLFVDNRAR
jgi:hypothetical protein